MSDSEPTFVTVQVKDLDTLLVFMEELFLEDRLPDQREFDSTRARSALEGLVHNSSYGGIWLICDGEAPVGYLALTLGYSLEFHGRDAFIDELYIRRPYRGRGWGTRATEHAEAIAKSMNIRAIHLEVGHGNIAARAFYRKAGYTDHDRYLMTKWILP